MSQFDKLALLAGQYAARQITLETFKVKAAQVVRRFKRGDVFVLDELAND